MAMNQIEETQNPWKLKIIRKIAFFCQLKNLRVQPKVLDIEDWNYCLGFKQAPRAGAKPTIYAPFMKEVEIVIMAKLLHFGGLSPKGGNSDNGEIAAIWGTLSKRWK